MHMIEVAEHLSNSFGRNDLSVAVLVHHVDSSCRQQPMITQHFLFGNPMPASPTGRSGTTRLECCKCVFMLRSKCSNQPQSCTQQRLSCSATENAVGSLMAPHWITLALVYLRIELVQHRLKLLLSVAHPLSVMLFILRVDVVKALDVSLNLRKHGAKLFQHGVLIVARFQFFPFVIPNARQN